jgi:hypothetical protein
MGILGAIVAALKALPVIASLVERFFDAWQKHNEEQARKEALELKAQKDSEVDAAIDGPDRVRDNGAGAAQQQAIDPKT